MCKFLPTYCMCMTNSSGTLLTCSSCLIRPKCIIPTMKGECPKCRQQRLCYVVNDYHRCHDCITGEEARNLLNKFHPFRRTEKEDVLVNSLSRVHLEDTVRDLVMDHMKQTVSASPHTTICGCVICVPHSTTCGCVVCVALKTTVPTSGPKQETTGQPTLCRQCRCVIPNG